MKYTNLLKQPNIQIEKTIDVNDIDWCNEAVLIYVKDGKGTLTHCESGKNEDEAYFSQLLLNDKPIIQGKYPICPTCMGMLATGYGIEKIYSQELTKVRECMNTEYKGIINAVENMKPLLGLLNDGYYVIADAMLYPSDGQGNFFYSVRNELTYNEATRSEYYDSEFFCSLDGFPAYIYPTQSSKLINEDRVNEYIKIMKSNSCPPRGLAYYEEGFMCALLDGHHKACAASVLGVSLNCLTIIPLDRFEFADGAKYADGDTLIKELGFAGIMIEVEQGSKLKDYRQIYSVHKQEIRIPLYKLTGRKFSDKYLNSYPSIHKLSGIINVGVGAKGNELEYAKTLIMSHDEESVIKLDCLIQYLSERRKEEAHIIAKMILDEEDDYLLQLAHESAIKELFNHRNEETEQYMINYLVNHNPKDKCWDLVNSYWD